MKKVKDFKRKFSNLIERIKLSESDYISMKSKAQMYDSMMSTIKCECNTDYEDIKKDGQTIARFPKSKTMVLNIDIEQMLANGGITFDKNAVKLNVKHSINTDDIIRCLDELKKEHPEQIIIMETPSGSAQLKIGDALIYEGMGGEIVIDSE